MILRGIVATMFAGVVGAALITLDKADMHGWVAFLAGFLSCAAVWILAEWWGKRHET